MALRFYAPWCGHCQNLKTAYEKAAKGLKDLAQVAAVNCDDDSNKAFCGGMGVQGFPTLKIIKPSKTPGKPSIEDYQGPRTASGIVDAVKSAIPNHVKRISDKSLDAWLKSDNETAKAFLFSEKGTTSALIKVLASEYLSTMKFAQIRNKEAAAVEMFGVEEYPTLFVLPGGTREAVKFQGSFTKESMKSFLSQFAEPGPSSSSKKQKPLGKKAETDKEEEKTKSETDYSTFSEASSSHASAEASSEAAGATTITLEDDSNPTESPAPMADPDAPGPAKVPHIPEPIPALIEENFLELQCLGPRTTTCILALLPQPTDDEGSLLPDSASSALTSLAEIADKHLQRGGKLFPFYSIPVRNAGQAKLRDMLDLKDNKNVELIALNTRRGWWRHYEAADGFTTIAVEAWVDAIRLGEGQKSKLPEGLVAAEEIPAPEHGEL